MDRGISSLLAVSNLIILVTVIAVVTTMTQLGVVNSTVLRSVPDEQKLLGKIHRNYDSSVRPVYNATHNVIVKFGMTLIQIMDLDEKNQVLVTNVWLEHEWMDMRMTWDPEEFNGLSVLRIPANKLWLPDIVLYNNADDYTTGYMPSNAMVHYDGRVFWSPPARLRSSCKVDITFFPFDEQICQLKFGSWTYDLAQVDIVKSRSAVDMLNYVTNGEWSMIATDVKRNAVVYPIGPSIYPDVTVSIFIHRRILYYMVNIILPCAWLNILSLLAFCLPPDAGEKVTLGITVLLSYSVFMLLVAENMPPTSEFVPLIGIYLTISMAVTSVSVVLTVFVLKLHHCGPNQSAAPHWVRYLVLDLLARVVRCPLTNSTPGGGNTRRTSPPSSSSTSSSSSCRKSATTSYTRKQTDKVQTIDDVPLRMFSDDNFYRRHYYDLPDYIPSPPGTTTVEQGVAAGGFRGKRCDVLPPDEVLMTSSSHDYLSDNGDSVASGSVNHRQQTSCEDLRACSGGRGKILTAATEGGTERAGVMEEILKYLKIVVSKKEEDERDVEIVDEWRHVAYVIDRFLFWCFLVTTLIGTVLILFVIPLCRQQGL